MRTPLILALLFGISACSAVEMQAVVTGYYGGDFSGITSTGVDTDEHPRGIAVAPSIIPYGSVIAVPGYGAAVADDTGGAMRKDARRGIVHIDLRFPSHKQAMAWGVRKLTITVEKQP